MGKFKIAIVEDEMIIAENICGLLEEIGYSTIEPCVSYGEAIEMLETESPDIVLLDIQLAGKKDGIDLAWVLKENYSIPFIFLTSNSDKATVDRAKEIDPYAFLVKPFKKDELFASIELAMNKFKKGEGIESNDKLIPDALFVKHNKIYHKIDYSEIAFVKSEGNYLDINTVSNKTFVLRSTFNEFVKELPKGLLFQVQRSFMVNPKKISAINSTYIVVCNHQIPIGRKYRQQLLTEVNLAK